MANLSAPPKEVAARIVKEVGFEERIMGCRFRERSGPMAVTLYSFREVVVFLNDRFPLIDFERLEDWTRETMGDHELAERIGGIIKQDQSDQAKTIQIRELMAERLLQCESIVV